MRVEHRNKNKDENNNRAKADLIPKVARQNFLVWLCIIATLWNMPRPLQAAEALEINRPRSADADLSITVDEDREASNADETVYTVKFKNLSDHEITYDWQSIQFPDLEMPPTVLTPEQAERSRKERELSTPRAYPYQPRSSSGPIFFPHPSPSPSVGQCKDACAVVAVIFLVFFVVIIIGAVAIAIKKSNKAEKERLLAEAAKAQRLSQNPKAPIRLLRYQETTRQIIIRHDSAEPIHSIRIDLLDKNDNTRTFKAKMGGASVS